MQCSSLTTYQIRTTCLDPHSEPTWPHQSVSTVLWEALLLNAAAPTISPIATQPTPQLLVDARALATEARRMAVEFERQRVRSVVADMSGSQFDAFKADGTKPVIVFAKIPRAALAKTTLFQAALQEAKHQQRSRAAHSVTTSAMGTQLYGTQA
jgi:hypothetical protein